MLRGQALNWRDSAEHLTQEFGRPIAVVDHECIGIKTVTWFLASDIVQQEIASLQNFWARRGQGAAARGAGKRGHKIECNSNIGNFSIHLYYPPEAVVA